EIAAQQNILLTKLVGVNAHLPGDAVDRALDPPCRLDLTRGARMTRRYFVGIDAAAVYAQVWNAIATPRGDDRVVRRGRAAGDVSPGVDDQVHIERRQSPVGFDANLGFKHFSMARILSEAMLLRRNQSHGAANLAREKNRRIVRRRRDL